ncbi:MAG: class I adenylate-forming enzyme family protein [Acidimicrobiia bacterium]
MSGDLRFDADQSAAARPTTIPALLARAFSLAPDREAVVLDDQRLTYRELDEQSRRMASGLLRRGMAKGARVGLWLGNGPDWVVHWAAVTRAGGVAVPMSTFTRGIELRKMVAHGDLWGIVTHESFLGQDRVAQLEESFPEIADADGDLAMESAPFLRWVLLLERSETAPDWKAPDWARTLEWATGVADDPLVAAAEQQIAPTDTSMMIFTSGTTSDPKGVLHTHGTVATKAAYLHDILGFQSDDRSYTALPFCWVGGLSLSLFPVLYAGATQICTDRFEAGEVLACLERERVTRAGFLPDKVVALRAHPTFATTDLSALTITSRALLPESVRDYGVTIDGLTMGLGMSETFGPYWWGVAEGPDGTSILSPTRPVPPLRALQPGVELRVVDGEGRPVGDDEPGEIQVRGACITEGLNKVARSDTFTDDGYLRTGDRGRLVDGVPTFEGRIKELIKTSGANVAPAEVVAALVEMDGISAAHVVGLADPVRGQIVAAALVAADGRILDLEQVRDGLTGQISPYKVPRHFIQLEAAEIPWNSDTNKLRRWELAQIITERITETS